MPNTKTSMLPDRVEPENRLFRQAHKEDKTFFRSCPFNYSRMVSTPAALQVSFGCYQKTEGRLPELGPLDLESLLKEDKRRVDSPVTVGSVSFDE
mmetsp:Transcript_16262/g.41857  ORF Transcript_16262/g.41857 Transcript_16262/m.41857 type:complete len:95 (-) Transcript_16262:58-342(-)